MLLLLLLQNKNFQSGKIFCFNSIIYIYVAFQIVFLHKGSKQQVIFTIMSMLKHLIDLDVTA